MQDDRLNSKLNHIFTQTQFSNLMFLSNSLKFRTEFK